MRMFEILEPRKSAVKFNGEPVENVEPEEKRLARLACQYGWDSDLERLEIMARILADLRGAR